MTVTIDEVQHLSVSEVAQRLATTETKVLMLLRQKVLTAEVIEGAWYVPAHSLSGLDSGATKAETVPECRTSCSASGCACR